MIIPIATCRKDPSPGITISASPIVIKINYNWLIEELKRRLGERPEIEKCLREMEQEDS